MNQIPVTTKEEFIKEAERLFSILKEGTREDIKMAKKHIEKLYPDNRKYSKKSGEFIMGIIRDFDQIKDIEHKSAVISGMSFPLLYSLDDYFNELAEFTLKNMENVDGRIREAMRKTASWLRIRNENQFKKAYENFIDRLENLMKKHAPEIKPFYIGNISPSVYKSLVLFWHGMVHGTSRDYEHREYLMDSSNENHIPFLGNNDSDEKEVDYDEVMENIWADKKDGNKEDGAKWLKCLDEMVTKRFSEELARLKFTKEESENIMTTLRVYGQGAGPGILDDIIPKGKMRGSILDLMNANNLVRGVEAFANHRIIKNSHGLVSHILVEALIEKEYSRSGKPDDIASFIKLIYQSHESVDTFMDWYEKKGKERFLWIIKIHKKYSGSKEHDEEYIEKLEKEESERKSNRFFGRSVAHHALDWYIQSDPAGFNRTGDPRKVTAYILKMVQDYNYEMTKGKIYMTYDNKDLSKFGGWKGTSNLGMTEYKITKPILEMVGDPDFLLIDPSKKSSKDFMKFL
ncbi:MAG: hypothetical protein Q7R78_02520 [bacterium]|nr:hypothetical protein [bacterium]